VVFDDSKTDVSKMQNALSAGGYPVQNVIYPENKPPSADAGADQTVTEGDRVMLNGVFSSDPDDGIAAYQWAQTSGESVILSNNNEIQPTFIAPEVSADGESLVFTLTVTDKAGKSDTDETVIRVNDSPAVLSHTELTPQQAKDMIDSNPDIILVDVREDSEFCGEGHIPGSLNYPWNTGVFQEKYAELPEDADILVICRTGNRSHAAATFLAEQGFTSVYDIGGITSWDWEILTCSEEPPALTASLNTEGGVSLNWSQYTGTNFESYLILRNTFPNAEYPKDSGYLLRESDVRVTSYTDTTLLTGIFYYRIVVVKKDAALLHSDNAEVYISGKSFPVSGLFSDFGEKGLYVYDGGLWTGLTGWNAENMLVWNRRLAADFGDHGLYLFDGSSWLGLTEWNAENMLVWDDKLVADFGEHGLYVYNGSSWTGLTEWNAENLIVWNGKLAADFGENGLFVYADGAGWTGLVKWDIASLMIWKDKLILIFEDSGSICFFDGVSCELIYPGNAENMHVWNDKLILDYGESGLYIYGSWPGLTKWIPEHIVNWKQGFAADFGDKGLYFYDGASWTGLTGWNPESMRAWGDKLAADFGEKGLYVYDGSSWTGLTGWDSENLKPAF
jgi:rhodanese-related sulfurtransferase